MEDQIRDILSTASFADADARIACEEKLRSLIGERDRALTNEYISKSNRDEMIPEFKHLLARAAEYERALNEIARANPVDLARDFNWPVRFARAALSRTEQKPAQPQEAYMVANAEGQIWYGAPEMEKEDAERACTDANRHGIGRAPHRVIKVEIREIPSP